MFLSACTFSNEEDLFEPITCEQVDQLTYDVYIKPILESRCESCHNDILASGGITLDTYEKLAVQVANGRFLGAIKHEPGFSPMPQGQTQLSQCQIENIEAWINNGFPEK